MLSRSFPLQDPDIQHHALPNALPIGQLFIDRGAAEFTTALDDLAVTQDDVCILGNAVFHDLKDMYIDPVIYRDLLPRHHVLVETQSERSADFPHDDGIILVFF